MKTALAVLRKAAEGVAALMMAAMFLTFLLQIAIRYSARLVWISEKFPFLEPSNFGWTLELCLALWVWIVFWGNAFVVRERDHVAFDILYAHVSPRTRKWFAIISAVAICFGLLWSLEPTWSKFYILRLKKSATLSSLLGDWIRMRHIYSIYAVFLIAVSLRYAWRVWVVFRDGAEEPDSHVEGRMDE